MMYVSAHIFLYKPFQNIFNVGATCKDINQELIVE